MSTTYNIPYYTHKSDNTSEAKKKTTGGTASTASNSFTLTDPNKKIAGFGQGKTPLSAKAIKSAKADYSAIRAIDTKFNINQIIDKLNVSVGLPSSEIDTHAKILQHNTSYYNRFKLPNYNEELQRGFGHVFFVAPSCNILSSASGTLADSVSSNSVFLYAQQAAPQLLQELSNINNRATDFSLLLSNQVLNFSPSDEVIDTDTYGKTYTGYKIVYGKTNIDSKTAGSLQFKFQDDRNLRIYQLHKLWVEYINGCYRGTIEPTTADIFNKVLDYTGAVYYILTAEDNESIIYWCKYYGIFPSTAPTSQLSWSANSRIEKPEVDVTYQYSFKDDYNPDIITEFNYNARVDSGSMTYIPTYDKKLGHAGTTYVGSPFIVIEKNPSIGSYEYKLRFKYKS